jgi:hypothetical protein
LNLAPYESSVIVFSKQQELIDLVPGTAAPAAVDISTNWKVSFDGSPSAGMSSAETMEHLESWTAEEGTKFFSGKATYEKSVAIPQTMLRSGHPLYLNFGEGEPVTTVERRSGSGMRAMFESPVREAAQVYVNDKLAGTVWHPPYELDVTALLHAGDNNIQIVVANLALNELAKGPLPDYKALNARYGERFQAQDLQNLQPVPAGLFGPVRIVAR